MAAGGYREEVLNVLLALVLAQRGVVAVPEQSFRSFVDRPRRRVPDALVDFQGLRVVIEGKVEDRLGAEAEVLQDAMQRVEEGIAHLGVAVIYPAHLRQFALIDGEKELSRARLRIAVCTEAGPSGWVSGTVDDLADFLRRTFEQLVQEPVVEKAVASLEAGIEQLAGALSGAPGAFGRFAEVLGIPGAPASPEAEDTEDGE